MDTARRRWEASAPAASQVLSNKHRLLAHCTAAIAFRHPQPPACPAQSPVGEKTASTRVQVKFAGPTSRGRKARTSPERTRRSLWGAIRSRGAFEGRSLGDNSKSIHARSRDPQDAQQLGWHPWIQGYFITGGERK